MPRTSRPIAVGRSGSSYAVHSGHLSSPATGGKRVPSLNEPRYEDARYAHHATERYQVSGLQDPSSVKAQWQTTTTRDQGKNIYKKARDRGAEAERGQRAEQPTAEKPTEPMR